MIILARMRPLRLFALVVAVVAALGGCAEVWNDPYPASDRGGNVLYSAFTERPKHLDPVQSYTEDEARFTQQVYEATFSASSNDFGCGLGSWNNDATTVGVAYVDADMTNGFVGDKVVRILHSYTDYVNRVVWHKSAAPAAK